MKKIRIFYGWYIVIALLLIWAVSFGVPVSSFTAYIEPLINKFGWNYTQVSSTVSVRSLVYALIMPLVGLAADRWSARKLIFAGITLTSIGIFLLGWINSLAQLYLCYILLGIGGSTLTATLPLIVVGRWFRKKLSFATGIVMSAAGAGGLLVPLVTRIIDTVRWQTAMLIMGLSMFVFISPLSLIIRQNPQQSGYLPDGDVDDSTVPGKGQILPQVSGEDIGIKQALKSSPFWLISFAFMGHVFAPIALLVHIMPYLSTIGIDRTTSSFVASILPMSNVFGRLLFGWSGDKLNKRWIAVSGTTLVGISLLMFIYTTTDTKSLLIPAVILCGMGWGGTIIMQPVLMREYFGTGHLGSIIGFSMSIMTIALIVSPPMVGWIYEKSGSYHIAWFTLLGVAIMSIICQLISPSATAFNQRKSQIAGNI